MVRDSGVNGVRWRSVVTRQMERDGVFGAMGYRSKDLPIVHLLGI